MHPRATVLGVVVALAVGASASLAAPAQAATVQVPSGSVRPAATRSLRVAAQPPDAVTTVAAADPCLCVNKPQYRHVRKQLGAKPLSLTSLVHRFGTSAQGKDVAAQTYL